jgi:hypothetical protein
LDDVRRTRVENSMKKYLREVLSLAGILMLALIGSSS